MFKNYINQDEIINSLQELIKIPSVHSKSENPSEPFGNNTVLALNYMLDLGKSLGFRTKNIDGYCGYIEFGEGSELIGIIGHLDVVPEGENWTYPPFEGKLVNNKIYGRGAIDDKGPVIASLYAMKTVMDYCNENNITINKRVRLILGLNEERDWKCIEYYKQHEEIPSIGFSPDADFPCIYAEKGLISPYFTMNYEEYENNDIVITDIDCNNNAINVVPKYCSCNINIKNNINIEEVNTLLKKLISKYDFDITTKIINDKELKIESHGIQAHAAHPDFGINSISRLIIILDELFKNYNITISLFDLFTKYIGLDFNGNKLEINIPDESGELTLNVSQLYLKDNKLILGLNLRVPINTKLNFIEEKFMNLSKEFENMNCTFEGRKEPLYISKDSYLVKTLLKIYNEATNSNVEPIAIGGATYARAFDNCISFGANLPGQKDMCHQTDEFISVDNLITAYKIYCKAIYELLI